jgi:anti-sigma-K factor RskA
MTHEDYQELLAANALTALDADDARALSTHLESCAACRSEMSEWEDTAALLALDAKSLEPSAQVRERILARVRAENRADKFAGNRLGSTASADHASGASQREGNVLAFAARPKKIWESLGSFGAMAAAVILAALIISLVVIWQQNRTTQKELARLSAEMNQAREQLDHERAVVALLTSPDARMAKLTGTNMAPDAHAMLAYDRNGRAMLMAKGLPAAPTGMAYQLWYIVGNKPMPGKVFKTESSGEGTLQDDIPAEAMNAAVFAVTLEPENGVRAPTGATYLRSSS